MRCQKRSVCCALAVGSCSRVQSVAECGVQQFYDLYSYNIIPALGQAVTGDRDSYRYLVESIRQFPDQDRFADMIRTAGLNRFLIVT